MRLIAVQQNIEVLQQGIELLDHLDDGAYSRPGPHGDSGVGPHFRHAIDFYLTFLAGLDAGRIDYDHRDRDETVASDRREAQRQLRAVVQRFVAVDSLDPGAELAVCVDAPAEAPEEQVWSRSTLLRELQFVLSHTVHHYALIARQLRDRGIDPGPRFGVATATLVHDEAPSSS